MVTDRPDDLKSIMADNATFIHFPPLGSSTSLITVYGDHRVNIQRAIRSIMQLVSADMDSIPFLPRLFLIQGLSILRWIFLALTRAIQCPPAALSSQWFSCYGTSQADIHDNRRGGCLQKHVF